VDDWAEVFTEEFARPASAVFARVFREVMGDDYPDGCDPHSYVSRTELETIARVVRDAAGEHLVDVGCGRGGPGLWVAVATGARLTGVDIAPTALEAARTRAAAAGVDAAFVEGRFEDLPLADADADVVMSIDALLFTPDKAAAVRELHRVLRPGGTLVLTSWDYFRQPEGRPPQVDDHRPLLRAAGFDVITYEDTVDWAARQRRTTAGLLAVVDELADETGDDPDELRAGLEEMDRTQDAMIRRFLAVARRR
jgi:SAM-dependent methyltransferase